MRQSLDRKVAAMEVVVVAVAVGVAIVAAVELQQ